MKRSEINEILRSAVEFAREMKFALPPFALWSRKEWEEKGHEYDEIRNHMLGWDITDFGSGDFRKVGLLMFTLRNGSLKDPNCRKTYAEKLLVVEENQVTPYHFHYGKMEDIINRGGGVLAIRMYNSTPEEEMDQTPVTVMQDGRHYEVPAGAIIYLHPGESVTIPTGVYHTFWALEGHGRILLGEVSKVNDDTVDNRFYEPTGRFPEVDEDEEPLYLLFSEYPACAEKNRVS